MNAAIPIVAAVALWARSDAAPIATVCAEHPAAVEAVELWRDAGIPLALGCAGPDVLTLEISDDPSARCDLGRRVRGCAYLGGPWGVAEPDAIVASHELGHLLGLEHPEPWPWPAHPVVEGCAARLVVPNPYGDVLAQWAAGLATTEGATVMDRDGCPGQSAGPSESDVAAVLAVVRGGGE